MNDRQLVLDTVEEICANTNDIDEVCMALEHSTIFATEMIQNLVEVIDKYKSTINKIKEKIDDYFGYDYKNESQARLDTINEINHIIVDLYNGGDEE